MANEIEIAAVHLERLRRHHKAAFVTGDHISLLDLSNTLRIWVQMKGALARAAPALQRTIAFKCGSPSRALVALSRGVEHVICYLGDETTTLAANGNTMTGPHVVGDFFLGVQYKRQDLISHYRRFAFIKKADGPRPPTGISAENVSRVNYVNWLGSTAALVGVPQSDGTVTSFRLSREMVINRVANTLDGSHPSIDNTSDNRFDPAIQQMVGSPGTELEFAL